jgi:hypothetical protein
MPRNGSNVYSKPAGTTAVSGATIESADFNAVIDDIATDLNTPRPVSSGGTGAANAADAQTNLGGTTVGKALFTAASAASGRSTLEIDSVTIRVVTSLSALKALDTTAINNVYLSAGGRSGGFVWQTGNFAARIAADTQEGLYVKADAIATTAGAWVRADMSRIKLDWFGIVKGGNAFAASAVDRGTDQTTQLQAAINAFMGLRGNLYLGAGNVRADTARIDTKLVKPSVDGSPVNLAGLCYVVCALTHVLVVPAQPFLVLIQVHHQRHTLWKTMWTTLK